MKVEILRSTVAGGENVNQGDVVNVSDRDGKTLIALGKAKLSDKKATDAKPAKEAKAEAKDSGK